MVYLLTPTISSMLCYWCLKLSLFTGQQLAMTCLFSNALDFNDATWNYFINMRNKVINL
ncbi:hypothetical protein XF_0456 [Xylella fastidiosa 9a5c]|uniref:Uncharacterized protein n=1 Tax=Xylella fastidiosa (strain 9a5c) TaxID=160492 RepID=Q9PG46_XYLFA|nr:hypothetical protein XF_0456 [Xylella fastidiosa 9a5c]